MTYMLEKIRTLQTMGVLSSFGHFGACGEQFPHGQLTDLGPFLLVVGIACPIIIVLEELILNEWLLFYTNGGV